jgi:tape measure domain-containing protein
MESLSYQLVLDNANYVRGMRGAASETRALGTSTQSANLDGFRSGLLATATSTVVLTGAVIGARAAFNSFAKQDSLIRGLATLEGSMDGAKRRAEELRAVAKLPGLGFEEAVQGDVRLRAVGYSAETSTRSLKAFGNALATVGAGKAELDGVILALGQIKAKGSVSAEEINQIAERVPQIRKAMQDAFGTADTEKLQSMGISVDRFVDGVLSQLEKLPRAAGGAANAVENLDDAWKNLKAKAGELIAPAAVQQIEDVTRMMEHLRKLGGDSVTAPPAQQDFWGEVRDLLEQNRAAAERSHQGWEKATPSAPADAPDRTWERLEIERQKRAEVSREAQENAERVKAAQEKVYDSSLSEIDNLERKLKLVRGLASEEAGHPASAQLSTAALNAQMPKLKGQANGDRIFAVQAERLAEIVSLEQRLKELRDASTEKAAREAESLQRAAEAENEKAAAAAKEAFARQEAAASFTLENRLLDAKAAGNERLIAQVERQIKLEDLKRQIMRDQGVEAAQAATMAEERVRKEEAARRREERGTGARQRSRLLGAGESEGRRLARMSVADRERNTRLGRGGLDNTTALAASARKRALESASAAAAQRLGQSGNRQGANQTDAILRRSQTTLDSIDQKLGDLGLAGGK